MRRRVSFVLVFFLLLSFLVFLNNKTSFVYNAAGFVQKLFTPPMGYLYNLKVNITNSSLSVNEQVKTLKIENNNLAQKIVDYENLKSDNNALRDQFQKGNIRTQQLLPAKVIGFLGRYEFPDSLIIDKGQADGVGIGYAVISEKNLVGVIKVSSKFFSSVALLHNKDFSVLGKTISGSAIGILQGERDFVLFDKVAITDNLQKGDIITTKGEVNDRGFGIPPDIIAGKVATVNKSENKPFQNAKIVSLIDYPKLGIVFVVGKIQ